MALTAKGAEMWRALENLEQAEPGICGVITKRGTPCRRKRRSVYCACWQHRPRGGTAKWRRYPPLPQDHHKTRLLKLMLRMRENMRDNMSL